MLKGIQNKNFFFSLFIFFISSLCPPGFGQNNVIKIEERLNQTNVTSQMEWLEDKKKNFFLKEILSSSFSHPFLKSKSDKFNFSYNSSAYWLHFVLSNDSAISRKIYLETDFPWFKSIELYLPDSTGGFEVKKTGFIYPFLEREVYHRNPMFIIESAAGEKKEIYARVEGCPLRFSVFLSSEKSFLENREKEYFVFGIFYGIMAVMILFNLFFYFSIKDSVFLWYIAFIAFLASLQLSINGYGFQFLWPKWTHWNYLSSSILPGLSFFFGIYFTKYFLNTQKKLPGYNALLNGFMGLSLLEAFLPLFYGFPLIYTINMVLLNALMLGAPLLSLLVAAVSLKKKIKEARYYLIGFAMLALGTMAYGMKEMALLPSCFVTEYGLQIGTVFLVVFLAMALGDRISLMKEERNRAQLELIKADERAIENLRRKDLLKDEFLANTSHELRMPLSGIIGIAETLVDGASGDLNEKSKENLSLIINGGNRLIRLIDDMLDFSQIKYGDLKLDIKEVDLYAAADIVLMLSKPLIMNKGIKLLNKVSPEVPPIRADENRLQQILFNLVGNAIKFTHQGSVEISAKEDGEFLEISVTDTGVGIPLSLQESIFESFERINETQKLRTRGFGLGLTITKKLVEILDGKIWVESEEEKGSKFFFTLPLSDQALREKRKIVSQFSEELPLEEKPGLVLDNSAQDEETKNSIKKEKSDSAKILIVDDDPVNVQLLTNQLSIQNYVISHSFSGLEALERLESGEKFDLILLDVLMPRISGYEVCKKIREKFSPNELPIVILTPKNLITDLVAAFEAGANDLLVKPFDKRELLARVKTMLRIKQAYLEHQKFTIMEKELSIAELVQKQILPTENQFKNFKNIEIEVNYLPKNKKVGGDYYSVDQLDSDTISIMVADASGHGIDAALSTMQLDVLNKQSLRIIQPDERLAYINHFFDYEIKSRNFSTGFILNIEKDKVNYSSAGHIAQYLLRKKTKEIVSLKAKGRPLGTFIDSQYERHADAINKGDIILLFTDGLIEEFNPKEEEFGEDGLYSMISDVLKNEDFPVNIKILSDSIVCRMDAFREGAEINDDVLLIGIKIL
jgi:signal transduction histidine kinase/serine phosphatase RsbU (regulator of sigma subunit)